MIAVSVQRAARGPAVPASARIRRWAVAAASRFRGSAELTVRVVGSEEGACLNRRYRGGEAATNVLAFPFEAPPGTPRQEAGPDLLGDVVICAPVVAEEARRQGKRPEHHWAHLVVHGVLHLLGLDHRTPDEARRMEGLERAILADLAVPDPYEPRTGDQSAGSDGETVRPHG